MPLPKVAHLIDDTTAGGVMRVLDHFMTAPELSAFAQHKVICTNPKAFKLARIDADVIVSHLAISWRALPMLLALKLRHPNATLAHVEHSYTEAFVAQNVPNKRRFATLLRLAYRIFDRVIAVSEAQGDWLMTSGAVTPTSLAVIPSFVDLSDFEKITPVTGRVKIIGAIGRLERQKGFDTLISAFRMTQDPDISLHIYGDGSEEMALRALAAGDGRIRFMGFENPVTAMSKVDAIAMPSRWEAYGLVAIEALTAGRALLVNKIDGLTDHLQNGALGIECSSIESWQHEIEKLTSTRNSMPEHPRPSNAIFAQRFANGWRAEIAAH